MFAAAGIAVLAHQVRCFLSRGSEVFQGTTCSRDSSEPLSSMDVRGCEALKVRRMAVFQALQQPQ